MTPLLTPDQVAERLGIRVKTVHRFVRAGKLGCVQVSPRERRFTPEQLLEFEAGRTITPAKRVDIMPRPSLPSHQEPMKGGEKSSGGSSRAQLKEEMRSWQ